MRKPTLVLGAAILAAAVPFAGSAHAAAPSMKFVTTMTGAQEVPMGDTHASGSATITLYPKTHKICYSLSVKHLKGKAVAAHIHKAAMGKAGGVVVPLTPPGANGRSVGCATKVAASLIASIEKHATQYYVNVHSTKYTLGAVRGQL